MFASINAGFDAIIGNPPWETLQPNSKEFFSNVDPLYRTYTKQDALKYQIAYFKQDSNIEKDWLVYCDNLKAFSNWYKHVALPFGDDVDGGEKFSLSRTKSENEDLHNVWRNQRKNARVMLNPITLLSTKVKVNHTLIKCSLN